MMLDKKSKMRELKHKILRHKERRRKHLRALIKSDLTLEERLKHREGMTIQTRIIDKLKKLREEISK